jgi:tRNA A-37 threonylcarbamoyl transferase component Bud32
VQEPTIFNNRYQILAKIGQGGLAEVYRAQDVALGRLVAVKALRPEYVVDPAFLVRFHREAQSAANLAHPNIVAVYDFGQDQGRPYIVMEYVPGQDLRTLLDQNRMLSVHQAVEVGAQVCAGVGYAHRSGLVHGDLKPGNVLVRPDGQAKVADFGLARALGESAMDEEGELVWGTPAYFAPEQAAGGTLVPATDVYAIGVILYEALTGQLPFSGDDADVARKHLYEMPVPVNKANTRVPTQLAHIVDKALQKKPEDRFATADGMAEALDSFRQRAERHTGALGLPGRSAPATMAADVEGEAAAARPAVDWVGLMLGVIAVIAILGLVPLYATVYRAHMRTEIPGRPTATATVAPGQVRVPDVVGAGLDDGRQALQAVGLKLEVVGQANHPTIPAFAIVEQTVRAGTPVVEGTTIGVVISQGPYLVEVPSVIDKSLGQAQKELQGQDLIPQTHHTWSEESPGTVTDQDPPAGSLVQSRSLITLTVSSGTQVPVGARLGDSILLLTYHLPRLDYHPGQLLHLTLAWQATAPLRQGYVVFVHLARADGSVVAQHDGLPSAGEVPTDRWSPGVQVVDAHDLPIPSDTAAGEYWLRVGMYGGSGRLTISDAGQAVAADDALVLSPIRVE